VRSPARRQRRINYRGKKQQRVGGERITLARIMHTDDPYNCPLSTVSTVQSFTVWSIQPVQSSLFICPSSRLCPVAANLVSVILRRKKEQVYTIPFGKKQLNFYTTFLTFFSTSALSCLVLDNFVMPGDRRPETSEPVLSNHVCLAPSVYILQRSSSSCLWRHQSIISLVLPLLSCRRCTHVRLIWTDFSR